MSFDFSKTKDSVTNPLSYFCNLGEDYEKYRPLYPDSAIDKILSGLKPPNQLLAADIGAGTGIGSRLLANRGVWVLAIEPNADMFQSKQILLLKLTLNYCLRQIAIAKIKAHPFL